MVDDDHPRPSLSDRTVDGRDESAIRADAKARAPFYTGEEWDPDAGGPGTALLTLFSELVAGVVDRLDQVPAKHRAAFVDALGFDRLPPQSARLPLSVDVSDGAGENVYLSSGTRAIASATESRPELTFELTDGFEATPAGLDHLVSADLALDHVATHGGALSGSDGATLFGGENEQRHRLYLSHPDVLTLDAGTTVQVRTASTAEAAMLAALEWEYYGETPDESDADDGWRRIEPTNTTPVLPGGTAEIDVVASILDDHGFELTTDDADAVARWLVATLLVRERADPVPPHVDAARQPAVADLYRNLDRYVERVYDDYPPESGTTLDGVTLSFDIDEPFVETEQLGVESCWLRASVPREYPPPLSARLRAVELQNVTIAGGRPRPKRPDRPQKRRDRRREQIHGRVAGETAENGTFPPTDLLANDVPLKVPKGDEEDEEFVRPFGMLPRVQDTFYVGSEEAFTKAGQRVTFSYERTGELDSVSQRPPHVSWEYWNGSAWDDLSLDIPDESESPELFVDSEGQFSFPVPEDFESTLVSGHEGYWIRARLVGGGYGKFIPEPPEDEDGIWQRIDQVKEPKLSSISLAYEATEPLDGADGTDGTEGPPSGADELPSGMIAAVPAQCYTDNNLTVSTVDPATRFQPFEPLPGADQVVYFGFNGPLDGGPLQVFVDVADFQYPSAFDPRVRWEVSTDGGWQRVSARDGTEGVTERGVVRFSPPTVTVARERFGVSRHWLRARVSGPTPFVDAPYRRQRTTGGGDEERCGDHLPTTPPGADAAMQLPEIGLVAHNTGMAANVRTVTDEVLGSSDGTPDQQFQVVSPPVSSPSVWVDELATLSAGARTRLTDDPDVAVEPVGDEADRNAFWVRWEEVEDFLASGPDDRHYTLDPIAGIITFGDGTEGAIPPRGRDNLRINYKTGGGAVGNVPAGTISDLEGSLAFVDSVTNPLPGDGGADAESTDTVLARAPEQLRDRNRAVAPADFERLALASARQLARARCLPGLDPRGAYQPGWVTVLLVPHSGVRKPVPSASLTEQVTEGLGDHAPASLLGEHGDERLVVRGPSYVEVTVDATLVAERTGSFAQLEEAADAALAGFLHPLTGGEDGEGWPFGELPCVSDCYGVLEDVAGVDHVADMTLTFEATSATRTIRPGQDSLRVDPDVLIHSGRHDLDVVGGA